MTEMRSLPWAGERPPRWRSLLLALGGGFMALSSWSFSPALYHWQHVEKDGLTGGLLFLGLFAMGAWIWALFRRHRFPAGLTLASAGAALVVPIGPVPALLSLAGLIERRSGRGVWLVAAAVAASTAWLTFWDALAQPRGASALKLILSSPEVGMHERVSLASGIPILIALLGLAFAIGSGLLLRIRREAVTAQEQVEEERRAGDALGDELARREERERIAREVHDAMGHRLSLLNLHAGALELRAEGDERLAESARIVSESARAAHADLRSLLAALREPLDAEPPAIPLTDLQQVVEDSMSAGEQLSSSIFIESAETADPTLSRAVYRVVQELLTNARKHAPGRRVRLTVTGGPSSGLRIEAANSVTEPQAAPSRESRGLTGIAERAELLGGSVTYGLDDGGQVFRVRVELPWRP